MTIEIHVKYNIPSYYGLGMTFYVDKSIIETYNKLGNGTFIRFHDTVATRVRRIHDKELNVNNSELSTHTITVITNGDQNVTPY